MWNQQYAAQMMHNPGRIHLISILLLVSFALNAQLMQFQQARKYFGEGDYYKALEYFNQAISQERSGNRAMLTEAYYFRGMTQVRLHGEAFVGDNKDMQKRHTDALLLAYQDFRSALNNDDGTFAQRIDAELKNLHHGLLQEGLLALNNYNDLVFNGKTDAKLLNRASDYLEAARYIRDSYLVNDLLGQVALNRGQQKEAGVFFDRSVELYAQELPDEPDFLMAYVFYRLAALHKDDDHQSSMQYCKQGITLMETEYTRLVMMKDKLSPGRVQQLEEQYHLGVQDLNNLRLDLYISDPGLQAEALSVFEQELQKDPYNTDLLTGYASLLEKSDKAAAIDTYKKILAVQPDHAIALFNLGALYYARGKDLIELAQTTTRDDQYGLLMEEAITAFESAKPCFEKSLEKEPSSLPAIQALKTIAFILDDKSEYQKYQLLEKENSR